MTVCFPGIFRCLAAVPVLAPLLQQVKVGQLVPLLITSPVRDSSLPNVPTAAEAGLPDLAITGFLGLIGRGRERHGRIVSERNIRVD